MRPPTLPHTSPHVSGEPLQAHVTSNWAVGRLIFACLARGLKRSFPGVMSQESRVCCLSFPIFPFRTFTTSLTVATTWNFPLANRYGRPSNPRAIEALPSLIKATNSPFQSSHGSAASSASGLLERLIEPSSKVIQFRNLPYARAERFLYPVLLLANFPKRATMLPDGGFLR